MSGFGFSPFYYGLEDALSLRNVWEQETNPVIITPRTVRVGIRKFEGRHFVVRRIDRSMFFGYTFVDYGLNGFRNLSLNLLDSLKMWCS